MTSYLRKQRLWFWAAAAIVIVLDQGTKVLAKGSLPLHIPLPVLGQTFRFFLTMNERGVFGLSYGARWVHYALPALLVLVVWLSLRSPGTWMSVALGLVLGGGVSNNLIDRVRFGAVIDFIDLGVGNWRWYTFNLADALGVAGIIMVLAYVYFGRSRQWPAAQPGQD